MKITISFKQMEHTEALDELINKKSQKLDKYLGGNTRLKWTCSVRQGKHYADVKLTGPSSEYQASAESDNMYKTLDLVVGKLEKQIAKKVDKWKGRLHRNSSDSDLAMLDPEDAWADHDEDAFDDVKSA